MTSWLQRFCASLALGGHRDERGLANRRQRIAQLVRQRRQELILALVDFAQCGFGALAAGDLALRRLVQARVVHGRPPPGPRRRRRAARRARVNTVHVGMAEEQSAHHLAGARDDRHREIAAHRQMALRHAVVRRHRAVARILRDVRGTHDALAGERRMEDRRIARHPEFLEGLARRARQGVQHERLALLVDDVVEERAELRARQLSRGVGDRLQHVLQIEIGTINLPVVSSSASTCACSRIASSERFWRVMSRAIFEAPTMRPLPSLMGDTVSETSISVPSLRRRVVW